MAQQDVPYERQPLRALVVSKCCNTRNCHRIVKKLKHISLSGVRTSMEMLHLAQLSEPFDIIVVDARDSIVSAIDTVVGIRSLPGVIGEAVTIAFTGNISHSDAVSLENAGFDEVINSKVAPENLLLETDTLIGMELEVGAEHAVH